MPPNPAPPSPPPPNDPTGADDRARSLAFLLSTGRELLGADPALADWEARLRSLGGGEDAPLRVAVAGTVKSGKSTLVNALVGRDLLKRGAGIITSLVTRLRPGGALRARIRLKGWAEVNREVTEAALFLGDGEGSRVRDLRDPADREELRRAVDDAGEAALGEGGFFDRNVALLRAYLNGYDRVADRVGDGPRTLEMGEEEFGRHRDFAGDDALAAYVDDLVLEIPGPPFEGPFELADCQGYDSPNPRHMEKVQEYLLGAHLVVYVVSSRVGLREADLRFVRDIKAMGLLGATRVVLNADLGEHASRDDLEALRDRVRDELRGVAGEVELSTFSALRVLLETLREGGRALERKEELLLELWAESPAAELDEHDAFARALARELGERRRERLADARRAVLRGAAGALRTRVEAALALTGQEARALEEEEASLGAARDRVERSLRAFENALSSQVARLREELFRQVDAAFHPSGGAVAEEVLGAARALDAPEGAREAGDRRRLFRQMARVYQEMRASFQRYKVEVANPRAVDRIRSIWHAVTEELAEAAAGQADLLIQSVEAYRRQAEALGIEIPPAERPPLDASIGKRTIPLFSAGDYAPPRRNAERVVSFAGQWTRPAPFCP